MAKRTTFTSEFKDYNGTLLGGKASLRNCEWIRYKPKPAKKLEVGVYKNVPRAFFESKYDKDLDEQINMLMAKVSQLKIENNWLHLVRFL